MYFTAQHFFFAFTHIIIPIFGLIGAVIAIYAVVRWLENMIHKHVPDTPIFTPKWEGIERRKAERNRRKEQTR